MSKTRYGHSGAGGGHQDQAERKDESWTSRQGGGQASHPGRRTEPSPSERGRHEPTSSPPAGTNTQGGLAGIGSASERAAEELDDRTPPESATGARERDMRGAGTDQPPRMGGPLGPDPDHPHLPEGAQSGVTRGSGAGGFDRGVDASTIGAVHQGVREEQVPGDEG